MEILVLSSSEGWTGRLDNLDWSVFTVGLHEDDVDVLVAELVFVVEAIGVKGTVSRDGPREDIYCKCSMVFRESAGDGLGDCELSEGVGDTDRRDLPMAGNDVCEGGLEGGVSSPGGEVRLTVRLF